MIYEKWRIVWEILLTHWIRPKRVQLQICNATTATHILSSPPCTTREYTERIVRFYDALLIPYGFASSYTTPFRRGRHSQISLNLDAILLSDHVCLANIDILYRPADPVGGRR